MRLIKFFLITFVLAFISGQASARYSDGASCKVKFEDCKARAFSEASTCRAQFDRCVVNELDQRSVKEVSADIKTQPKAKKQFQL